MKSSVVVFIEGRAHLLKEHRLKLWRRRKNIVALINPDLHGVEGVPTRFWKLDQGRIVEMTRPEKIIILLEAKPILNPIGHLYPVWAHLIPLLIIGFILFFMVQHFFKLPGMR